MNILQYKKLEYLRKRFEKTGRLAVKDFFAATQALASDELYMFQDEGDIQLLETLFSNWNVFWKEFAPIAVGQPGKHNAEFNMEWYILSRNHNNAWEWILTTDTKKYQEHNAVVDAKEGASSKNHMDIYTLKELEQIPCGTDDFQNEKSYPYVIDIRGEDFEKRCPLFLSFVNIMKKMGIKDPDNCTILKLCDIANSSSTERNYNQDFIDGKVDVCPWMSNDLASVSDYYDEIASEEFLKKCGAFFKKMKEDFKKKYIFSEKDEKQVDEYLQKKRGFHSLSYSAQKEMEKMAKRRGDLKIDFKENMKFKPMTDAERVVLNKVMGSKIR